MNFAMEENKKVRSSNKSFNFKVNREKVATKEMEEDKKLTNETPY
jgi:hypothetical protein